ncbi:MAG: phosphate signaling complex protein PhoU [Terrisporobacter othiniensis]|uniref:Phosphate-specific transport system accessory protein PhoU n=2 Tax=Terrisporobacter hibernicus TaxID=2813371 RepID=A0AAX2ZJT5_9FIRM|nr:MULTISPECIES: phosphate signaling complex protein PhoU [Terrisporobacter]MBN9647963.1 phosphate signaling complex protein PhoU [Terrisporobacter glycolicus]MDU4862203.1 phosphate signaling complex protein PhoU [Terrisporobacter othiniensis]MDU6995863.1 phosphate signaling complex protein PhoU [Terrisporobacter othiniensis]UEL49291.1 phosphate signaling complex protein PhoU [Terrisporobacter hibernicus]SFJ53237.1 phosphate transport system protein [Terrisporobacter glycolicus]
MVITNLDISIQSLKEYTLRMIEKCQDSVDLSVEYMIKKDMKRTKKIIREDDDIDILREYIRDRSIELMALKQPLARDLRYIYAICDISTELERIGDYAANICRESLEIGEEPFIKELIDIPIMKEICCEMLKDLWVALKDDNANLAYEIAQKDSEIDLLYERVRQDCLQVMHSDPEKNINQGMRLVFIGRYIERIGDHITNICEKIIYAKNGEMIEIG